MIVFHRHIEIKADDNFFARNIDIIKGAESGHVEFLIEIYEGVSQSTVLSKHLAAGAAI